ncbi:MAG: PRC-barrel domain-containing protein [Euryarchaeota archaeon]|nr:PRC-barrel domain-containing protein [Euryarchaeota archaeon]
MNLEEERFEELFGKLVVNNYGRAIGLLEKLYVDRQTGIIKFLGIRLNSEAPEDIVAVFGTDDEGMLLVPREYVLSMRDFVIIKTPRSEEK